VKYNLDFLAAGPGNSSLLALASSSRAAKRTTRKKRLKCTIKR